MALLQGSDAHPTVAYEARSTWLYLPEVTLQWLKHAFATHEASISREHQPPSEPEFWIKSIRFDDGQYAGRAISFSPRTNALIGPPSSGKSLIIDAIRYLFDDQCPIADVQSSIERRLTKCLPDGTTVVVEIEGRNGRRELRRVRGGTTTPETESKPIVFSQVELARRSMEPIPSVDLLDIHCPESASHKSMIKEVSDKLRLAVKEIIDLAKQAGSLRLEVENEQEGLEATKSAYLSLVGDEETAKSLGDLRRIDTWHSVTRQRLEQWREHFQVPTRPQLPASPQFETDLSVTDYVPSNAIPEALNAYDAAVVRAADELVAALRTESKTRTPKVEALRNNIQARLGSEQDATSELADQAERYRNRLTLLEQKSADLGELDKSISDSFEAIDTLIDQSKTAWSDLRRARKVACSNVNQSMPSFFVRLSPDSMTEEVDALLYDLRTGTRLQEPSVQAVRDMLDRKSFVKSAIEHLQFPALNDVQEDLDETSTDARKIAHTAIERGKFDSIARLAAMWPSDGIEILHRRTDGDPVSFDNLTEGLKALAIKEISFAASRRPVVTDQPEDAVPTTAIFENLVPTVREQRASRQFIIASHDANIVVSGDMERVIALPAEASEQPIVGTLFDASIRERAIALLEGGDRAFELRRKRYGDYG